MDHEGTSLRSPLHLAARRARLRGVGLSSPSMKPGAAKKDARVLPPPPVGSERSRLNSLVSEALRAQPAAGIRIDAVEPERVEVAAASAGHNLDTELPSLPSLPLLKNTRPKRGKADLEVKVELVAAVRPVEVKPAEEAEQVESALPAEQPPSAQVELAGWVEQAATAEKSAAGERAAEPAEREAAGEPESEPTVADSVQEIDIDIDVDVDIDIEDLGDPKANQRRLLYFLRDRFINAPERVDAALQAYRGKYRNIADYVRDVIRVEPMADWLRPYIDTDKLARDWRREGIIWAIDDPGGNGEGPGVYIFLG